METVYRDDIKCVDETVQPHLTDISLFLALQGETWLAPPGLCKLNDSTVTILDWDDTILCTSLLSSLDFPAEMPNDFKDFMHDIEEQACLLLTEALALGPTYIVTNAVDGWVHDSASQYLPGLLPLLDQVTVISARSLHAMTYPDQPGVWKCRAFLDLMLDKGLQCRDLVVIGDSLYEMEAGSLIGQFFQHVRVKMLKLKENPSVENLSQQLNTLQTCFKDVASIPNNFFVRLDEGSEVQL